MTSIIVGEQNKKRAQWESIEMIIIMESMENEWLQVHC